MEKEFIIDQEDVQVVAVDNIKEESEVEEADYSVFSDDDFTSVDESEIDWSTL